MAEESGGGAPLKLSPGAEALIEDVLHRHGSPTRPIGALQWLIVLLEQHDALVVDLVGAFEPEAELARARARVAAGELGPELGREELLMAAAAHASAEGKRVIYESDLAVVIVSTAGYTLADPSAAPSAAATSAGAAAAPAAVDAGASAPAATAPKPRPTPTLDEIGRDLTKLARDGKLSPLVGRGETLDLIVETLCRRTTRNPALIGPPGIGKTAIVEGLAQRIVAGQVPPFLRNARLVELQSAAIVAGMKYHGSIEERMQKVIAEASQEGIVLFIDELHSIMGAGGMPGTSDVASQLKPALARGDIACIAATTDEEYRRFIEPDKALERRFQPIRIQEPSAAETLAIVNKLAGEFERTRGIRISDDVQRWIVDYAAHNLPNRRFPAKAVDLLEQCVAHAIALGRTELDAAESEQVGQRMTGVPGNVATRKAALTERLEREGLLPPDAQRDLLERLEVTLRGLDLRPHRPNVVVLLHGAAAGAASALADAIAETLFGAQNRIVQIDFGRFAQFDAMTSLLGAPPGYIGHGDALPIHRIVQMPWCVLRCDNLHACHPQVRGVLAQACENGYFTDARDDRIYLSDTVVILTADVEAGPQRRTLGLTAPATPPRPTNGSAHAALEEALGAGLVTQCDVIAGERGVPADELAQPAELRMLAALEERFEGHGLALQWDASVTRWLQDQRAAAETALELERLVDRQLGARLARYESETHQTGGRAARVRWDQGTFVIEAVEPQRP